MGPFSTLVRSPRRNTSAAESSKDFVESFTIQNWPKMGRTISAPDHAAQNWQCPDLCGTSPSEQPKGVPRSLGKAVPHCDASIGVPTAGTTWIGELFPDGPKSAQIVYITRERGYFWFAARTCYISTAASANGPPWREGWHNKGSSIHNKPKKFVWRRITGFVARNVTIQQPASLQPHPTEFSRR